MQQQHRQDPTVMQLKQQVHNAFMQVNEMERLFTMEIEHARQQLQEREKELEQRELAMTSQQQSLTNRLKQCHYLEGMSELDDASIPDIPFVEQSERDSGIYTLLREEQSPHNDADGNLTQLRELHRAVQSSLSSPLPQLTKLFTIACETCLENYRLREQLQNHNQMIEVLERKLNELSSSLTTEHSTTEELKRMNNQLTLANTDLEAIARMREIDLIEKKRQCDSLKRQNTRLQETLRNHTNQNAAIHKQIMADNKTNQPKTLMCANSKLNVPSKSIKPQNEQQSHPLRQRLSLQTSLPQRTSGDQSLQHQHK